MIIYFMNFLMIYLHLDFLVIIVNQNYFFWNFSDLDFLMKLLLTVTTFALLFINQFNFHQAMFHLLENYHLTMCHL